MTTDHINRWNLMSDDEFIPAARHYRKFRGVTGLEHKINIDYLIKRCNSLGYEFQTGCCNRNYVTKKDDIQE